jgi:hypothetical protein
MNLLRLLTSPLPVPASWYAIPLRLIVGFGFIQHGYAKLAHGQKRMNPLAVEACSRLQTRT